MPHLDTPSVGELHSSTQKYVGKYKQTSVNSTDRDCNNTASASTNRSRLFYATRVATCLCVCIRINSVISCCSRRDKHQIGVYACGDVLVRRQPRTLAKHIKHTTEKFWWRQANALEADSRTVKTAATTKLQPKKWNYKRLYLLNRNLSSMDTPLVRNEYTTHTCKPSSLRWAVTPWALTSIRQRRAYFVHVRDECVGAFHIRDTVCIANDVRERWMVNTETNGCLWVCVSYVRVKPHRVCADSVLATHTSIPLSTVAVARSNERIK